MATTSIDKLFSFLEEQNPILFKGQPPRPGLVPKTGDYEHPFRWIKPTESLANKDNIGYSMKDAVDRINSISFRSAERQKQFPLITPSNFIKQIAEASSFWQRDGWIKIREAAHNILFKNISIKDKTHLYAITLLEALNLAEPISQNLYRGVGVGAIDIYRLNKENLIGIL